MIDMSNPATRLEHWLQTAYSLIPASDKEKAQTLAIHTFCDIWGIDPTTSMGQSEFLRRAAAMLRLGQEVRIRVESDVASPMSTAALKDYAQVERVLDNFLRPKSRLHEFFQPINHSGWYALSLCARTLTVGTYPALQDEDVMESLIAQTRDLIDNIREAEDIGEAEKTDLIARLRTVEDALAGSGVTGQSDVSAAVDGLFGAMVRMAVRGSSVIHHPAAQGIFGLINAIAATIGLGADVSALADGGLGTLKEIASGA